LDTIRKAAASTNLSESERSSLNKVLSFYGDAEKEKSKDTKVVVGFSNKDTKTTMDDKKQTTVSLHLANACP
jgi:hypothetical protein